MSTLSISKAIREGLHEEMVRDENVVVLGEDMAVMGNVFAITQGFLDEFGPNRVIDTPISESGFTGMAVGMAMRGLRPVVEWMYDDFITVCLDPVMNQAAKMRYMTGGQVKIPIVFRAPIGAGRRNAGQHSQCLEALFTHIPGLKVVCPSTGADAKGLLKSAIRCDDPVVFLEHKLLYAKKEQIPDGEYLIPLGKADVKRPGKDLTILTWSRQVYFSLEAAETLAAQGIGYFGDDDTYITEIKGVTIGIVGYTYPINEGKLKKYQKKIEELREAGCTFIIASAHWGKEESLNINLEQRQGAPALIDMGADLVYGHGSHTVQPLQIYNGKLICYSLSNFTFGANAAPEDDDTVVLQVSYDIAADGSCTLGSITALPYKMHKDKDFRPYPIEDAAGKEQVWRKLVFQGEKNPDSGLPESFLTTGYADFRGMMVVDEE